MTQTIWGINNHTEGITAELVYYHFGKEPKFPAWYMEKDRVYTIEVIRQYKLSKTFGCFFKCLTRAYIIR